MTALFVSSGFLPSSLPPNSQEATLDWENWPPFLRVLLTTDGTVTKSLESYFWEPVEVLTLSQAYSALECDMTAIDCTKGDKVWLRDVSLKGSVSGCEYATAQSYIRLQALPHTMQLALKEGRIGIGEFLRECEYETYREILAVGESETNQNIIWRTYRIMMNKKPLMQITERFNKKSFE